MGFRRREAKGTPAGGRFKAGTRAEVALALGSGSEVCRAATELRRGDVILDEDGTRSMLVADPRRDYSNDFYGVTVTTEHPVTGERRERIFRTADQIAVEAPARMARFVDAPHT